MVEWQKEWKEIEFDVTEIYLISRLGANDTPFDIRYAIPLQQASSTAEPETTTAVRLPPPSFVPHPIECDERAEVESKTRVIVFNIPFDVTEDDLIELFRGIGERLSIAIDDVKLIRKPKQSARFGTAHDTTRYTPPPHTHDTHCVSGRVRTGPRRAARDEPLWS
jgi:RNA recognition motif-containing protein